MRIPPSLVCVAAWSLMLLATDPENGRLGAALMLAAWIAARMLTLWGRTP